MSILETPEWLEYMKNVRRRSISVRHVNAVVTRVAVRDVPKLIDLQQRGRMPQEREAALRVLDTMARSEDRRLAPQHRARWIATVARKARSTYPSSDFYRWMAFDPAGALQFLVKFNPQRLDEERARAHALHLRGQSSEPAVARLRQLAAGRSAMAKAATEQLEQMGFPARHAIAVRAAAWRQRRRRADLSWLYGCVISRASEGVAIAPLLKMLGRPDQGDGTDLRWNTKEPRGRASLQLMLLSDGEGRLVGWKLK
jgi:hypothetical protein